MFIPAQFIAILGELRNKNTGYPGESAAKILDIFANILSAIHTGSDSVELNREGVRFYRCENGMLIRFIKPNEQKYAAPENQNSATMCTLATARHFTNVHARQVAVYTGDSQMMDMTLIEGIDAAPINPDIYTGRRRLAMPKEACELWFKNGFLSEKELRRFFPNEEPFRLNEFVEFVFDPDTPRCKLEDYSWIIGRFWKAEVDNDEYEPEEEEVEAAKPKSKKPKVSDQKPEKKDVPKTERKPRVLGLHRLRYIRVLLHDGKYKHLRPRTAGQAMFAEALLAPYGDIPIVICPATFGTGKTYLSTGIGLTLVQEKQYDRVFICPRDSRLGDQVGFVPGDIFAKTIEKSLPIVDNVRALIKNRGDKAKGGVPMDNEQLQKEVMNIITRHFELSPIINMGGRTIADAFIILDEAQDLERGQVIQLMERLANHSKMVIIGDPSQVTNRHMNRNSNGVSYAASKMGGNHTTAVVTMYRDETQRCPASIEIAKCFGIR